MAATQFATDTPLVVTGLIATAGIFSLWSMWVCALALLFLGFVLAGLAPNAGQFVAFTPGEARDASLVVLSLHAIQWIAQRDADGTGYLALRCMACRWCYRPMQKCVAQTTTRECARPPTLQAQWHLLNTAPGRMSGVTFSRHSAWHLSQGNDPGRRLRARGPQCPGRWPSAP